MYDGGPVNRGPLRRGVLIICGVNWAALEQILAFKICVSRLRIRLLREDRAALKFDKIRARTRYAEHLFKIIQIIGFVMNAAAGSKCWQQLIKKCISYKASFVMAFFWPWIWKKNIILMYR